jgi:hypothetical protein
MATAFRPFRLRKNSESYSAEMKDFLGHMLVINIKTRWNAQKLLTHQWLKKWQPFKWHVPNSFLRMLKESKEKPPNYDSMDFDLSHLGMDSQGNVEVPKPERSFWQCLKSKWIFY